MNLGYVIFKVCGFGAKTLKQVAITDYHG